MSMAKGSLIDVEFSDECTVVKYLVPDGYPDSPKKDAEVSVDAPALESTRAEIYYASVYENSEP